MRVRTIATSLALILLATGLARAGGDSPDEKRDKTRKMSAKTLQDLYKLQPGAQGGDSKVCRVCRLRQHGDEPASVEHGAWLRNCRRLR